MKLFKNRWFDLTDEDRNQLVFSGRNKEYGAYLLRKKYNQTLVRSLAISGLTIVGLFLVPQFTKIEAKEVVEEFEEPDIEYIFQPPPEQKEEESSADKEEKKMTQTENNSAKRKVAGDVTNEKDTSEEHKSNHLFVDVSIKGKHGNQDPDFFPKISGNGMGLGTKINLPNTNTGDDLVLSPTVMPEYYGGVEALYAYLGDHLQFPEAAKREGVSGKVQVGFIVEKDGSISGIKILKCNALNLGFEEETIRVIKDMPKWKPGQQNGRSVRVRFNIPITYKLF